MSPIEIGAEKIFSFFGMPITNTLLTSWVAMGILVLTAILISKKVRLIPSPLQNVFEVFVDKFLGLMAGVFGSSEKAEKYFPLIATIFIFILLCNWLGILPGIGSIGFFEQHDGEKKFVPFFRSTASDLNFTLALAIVVVLLINIFGAMAIGIRKHISKFFSFGSPIDSFVGILELISELARIISFAFRLFGNIFAGEVLLIIIGSLAPLVVPVPFLILEIFVGFVQALVFAMLTMVFISIAIAHH